MNDSFLEIYEKAKPIYATSRAFDAEHIAWMFSVCEELCLKENLDADVFIPLVLLHDIGYAKIKENFWGADTRRGHMEAGAKMAEEILEDLNYPADGTKKIVDYIKVHDEWALGNHEIYKKDKLLGNFTDLDFIWMASQPGFPHFMKELNKTSEELIDWLVQNEKLTNRPFASMTTAKLFEQLIADRKNEY